jgi:hypothetical protein
LDASTAKVLSTLHPTITSLSTVHLPKWFAKDVEGWSWNQLTSLSFHFEGSVPGDHHLFDCLPRLMHYHGRVDPSAISKLPLSLTSLHTTSVSANHVMDIVDHLPSLTHLRVDETSQYTDYERRILLFHHPTLTSIGGGIWSIKGSALYELVGPDGLPHLKSISVGVVKEGFTNAMMKMAPNLTQIEYQLTSYDVGELKALSLMKSLTHLRLTIGSALILPLLVSNVSHVLKDLMITAPLSDGDHLLFESFRGLTQLTSLTFQGSRPGGESKAVWFDSFASIGLPLLPFVVFTPPIAWQILYSKYLQFIIILKEGSSNLL